MVIEPAVQRIAQLTAVSEVLSRLESRVAPIAARSAELISAIGCTLAEDLLAPTGQPSATSALRDGFAVLAESTSDASAYTPAPLAFAAPIDVGEPLPQGTDAVAPIDAIEPSKSGYRALQSVATGEGALAACGDIQPAAPLRIAGCRLRAVDQAVLAAAGIKHVRIRQPTIRLIQARPRTDAVLDSIGAILAHAIATAGSLVLPASSPPSTPANLTEMLRETTADAVIVIGGTGSGRHDDAVKALARVGRVEMHGIALLPGETAAFGFIDQRPALLIPGRLDAALAVWSTIGHRMLACLSGTKEAAPLLTTRLSRKISSQLGMTEVIPIALRDSGAEPLAAGYWPLSTIVASSGWVLIPPESEGHPVGSKVDIRLWS